MDCVSQQLLAHQNAFVALTAEALKLFQASLPPDSTLLRQPATNQDRLGASQRSMSALST